MSSAAGVRELCLRAEMNEGVALGDDVSQGEDGVCFICLGTSPSPIHLMRVSRGRGSAHLRCRVRAAEALVEQKKNTKWWWTCQTCKQQFTDKMRDGLANAWWSHVCDRAKGRQGEAGSRGQSGCIPLAPRKA